MSHYTSADLAITNLEDLRAACAALGYELITPDPKANADERDGTVQINGWGNQRRRVAAKLSGGDLNRYGYEIGFRQRTEGGNFEMIADWMGAKFSPSELKERLENEVALAASLAELAAMGYSDVQVIREAGEIRLVAQPSY